MNISKRLRAPFAVVALALAGTASADVMISGIDMEVRRSTYQVTGGETSAGALAQFQAGSLVCDVSLGAVTNVGSSQTCGGPTRDIATLISISLTQTSNVTWQFGPDWGRGGYVYVAGVDEIAYTEDLWWAGNWSQAIEVTTSGFVGPYTLNFLGFENGNGGGMSARYSTDDGRTWSTVAVNTRSVPEPGTMFLFGMGLLGLGAARRRLNLS